MAFETPGGVYYQFYYFRQRWLLIELLFRENNLPVHEKIGLIIDDRRKFADWLVPLAKVSGHCLNRHDPKVHLWSRPPVFRPLGQQPRPDEQSI